MKKMIWSVSVLTSLERILEMKTLPQDDKFGACIAIIGMSILAKGMGLRS